MKSDVLYTLEEENAKLRKAFTRVAYHTQRARFHLDQISTTELAKEIGLSKRQSLQQRINVYKKEVAK